MIFVFYWGLMSYDDFARILSNRDRIESQKELFVAIVQHLIYPVILWFTLFLERTHFTFRNVTAIVAFAVVYVIMNGYITLTSGVPVYDVIDWQSASSHIHLALGLSLVFIGFYISTKTSITMNKTLGFYQTAGKVKQH